MRTVAPDLQGHGGGTVQALSVSFMVYSPITVACDMWCAATVPICCYSVYPSVLQAFHVLRTIHHYDIRSLDMTLAAQVLRRLQVVIEAGCARVIYEHAFLHFSALLSTDKRLLVLDMLGDPAPTSRYVDDLMLR